MIIKGKKDQNLNILILEYVYMYDLLYYIVTSVNVLLKRREVASKQIKT
jgi:hypothetical protein